MVIRDLKAEEIEVRVGMGGTLLLYKDARCDMAILDDSVGPMNWQRKHSRDNANCQVGIYNENTKEWVWKEDTGTESNVEKDKGIASDSFKRACTNWGIGRELYTGPVIKPKTKPGKYDKFKCNHIKIENKQITQLGIVDNYGNSVFKWVKK